MEIAVIPLMYSVLRWDVTVNILPHLLQTLLKIPAPYSRNNYCNIVTNKDLWTKTAGVVYIVAEFVKVVKKVFSYFCSNFEVSFFSSDTFRSSSGAYVGCFHNSDPLQQLKHRYEGHPAMVPDICVQHCGSNGFTFAGLLMASECLCGLYFKGESKVRNEECMLPCQGDRERSCGGQKFIAIYSTS